MMMVREQIVGPMSEPAALTQHEQILDIVLRPDSIEVGLRRAELREFHYVAGEMMLTRRHVEEWIRTNNLHFLSLTVSDAALSTASGSGHEVELRSTGHLVTRESEHSSQR